MRAAIVAMIVLLCAHEPMMAQLANCQAKTCSQASSACLTQCLKTGTDCVHCHKAFTKCMLTGEFAGGICNFIGLSRK
jgi:hypothetical protein